MSNSIATITGNLTRDPELKYTASGKAVIKMTVASTPRSLRDGEWVDGETSFWDVDAWENLAEHCARILEKGASVIVEGRLAIERWENEEGEPRSKPKLTATRISLPVHHVEEYTRFSSKKEGQTKKAQKTQKTQKTQSRKRAKVEETDEVPF